MARGKDKKEKMVNFILRLPEEKDRAARIMAAKLDQSRQEFIRDAIEHYVSYQADAIGYAPAPATGSQPTEEGGEGREGREGRE